MSDDKRTKAISAVEFAAVSDIDNLASDRLQAMVGGHGMLNLSVYAVADVIAEQLMRGADIKMTNANAVRIPLQDVVQKCLDVCKAGGCDPANAALITAVELYHPRGQPETGSHGPHHGGSAEVRRFQYPHFQDQQQDQRLPGGAGYLSGHARQDPHRRSGRFRPALDHGGQRLLRTRRSG